LRQGLPSWGVGPDAYERFLRHILCLGRIAEDATGKSEHGRQMAARKQLESPLVATRDPGHERLVAVIHCNEMAAIGHARPF
jgi:hypothetical protein